MLLLYTVFSRMTLVGKFLKINSSVNSYLDFYKVIMETTQADYLKYCKKLPFSPFHIKET